MTESIIVGVVVGVVVAGMGAVISHYLRRWEMTDLWAEEERRRKSDRRRELYERDLGIVSDFVHALIRAMAEVQRPVLMAERAKRVFRLELLENLNQMIAKASVVTISADDQELGEGFNQLIDVASRWVAVLDLDTGEAIEGKEKEFEELAGEAKLAASEVLRRKREILMQI